MPSHIRSVLTATSLGIPVMDGRLALGRGKGCISGNTGSRAHAADRRACLVMSTGTAQTGWRGRCFSVTRSRAIGRNGALWDASRSFLEP